MASGLYVIQGGDDAWSSFVGQIVQALNDGWNLDQAGNNATGALTTNATYATTTTFTVPGDQTLFYTVTRRLRIVHAGGTTYCEVSAVSFGAGVTTVTIGTITSGPATMTSAITSVSVSPLLPGVTGNVKAFPNFADGTNAAPSVTFITQSNIGMYRVASNRLGFASNGTQQFEVGSTYVQVIGTSTTLIIPLGSGAGGVSNATPSLCFVGDTASGLYNTNSIGWGFCQAGGKVIEMLGGAGTANYFGMYSASSGNSPEIRMLGSNANIGLLIRVLGIGRFEVTDNNSAVQIRVVTTASAVNVVHFTAGATGTGPTIGASGLFGGGDANQDLRLTVVGTGVVNFRGGAPNNPIALGGGAAATLGTIGAAGPGAAGQNKWWKIKVEDTVYYVPIWI